MHVSPNDGGCWYCYTQDEKLIFSTEFDTYVHEECIKQALKNDPEDREAQVLAKELL